MSLEVSWLVETVLAALWRATWQGAVVVLAAAAVDSLWQSMPASLRSWMWRLVFVKIALAFCVSATIPLPLLPAAAPRAGEAAPLVATIAASAVDAPATRSGNGEPSGNGELSGVAAAAIENRQTLGASGWCMGIAALWAAGFAGGIYLQRRGRREVLSQHRRSHPMERGAVVQIVRSLAERLGLAPAPQVRCTPGGGSPCVIGGPASAVLLPLEWLRICTPNQLQLALAHELAHVRRRDLAWNQFVSVCCAALFFHPLVWLAARRYLAAQELACDALALERTNGSPIEFARLLLQFAEQPAAPQWGGVAAMTGATMTLRERIEAMTRPMKMTQTVGAKLATALLAAAGLLPVSLSAQPPADAPSASRGTESKTEDAPATESASPSVSRREKKSSSIKKSASASASASSSGMASGIGLGNGFGAGNGLGNGGTNGNGRGAGMGAAAGRADANARAKVAVSISTDEPEEEEEEPLSRFPQTSHRGSKSSVRQSMTAKNDGNGEAWSRTTEANDDGREIKIEERPDDIRMTIVENGAKQTITAKDASELEANDPEAAELYRKYASKPAAARAGGSTVSISGGGNSATKLLRDQLKEMMESEDVQGAPLQDLLKELEQQVDEAE